MPGDPFRPNRLRARRGRRVYFREVKQASRKEPGAATRWVAAAEPVAAGTDGRPRAIGPARRLFRYSWVPGEKHFAGPGVEIADGSLVHAGRVHHGLGLQPGGIFVVRRDVSTGDPHWVFRTDSPVTDLDAGPDTAYVAYQDGEIVALGLADGHVRWRQRLPGVFPTALTAVGADRLLIGSSDGRVLLGRMR